MRARSSRLKKKLLRVVNDGCCEKEISADATIKAVLLELDGIFTLDINNECHWRLFSTGNKFSLHSQMALARV